MQDIYRTALNRLSDGKPISVKRLINARIVKGFSLGNVFWTALFACLSHVFVDIRFEPYGFAVYPHDLKLALAIGYGLVLGTGFYLGHMAIKNDKLFWPVWKEMVWILILTIVITTINYFYRLFILKEVFDMSGIYKVSFLRYMLVGAEVVGSTALVFKFFQTVLLKSDILEKYIKHNKPASEGQASIAESQNKYVCLNGNNVEETLFFYADNLLYVKSNGNYVQVFTKHPSAEKIEKHMIRLSMSGFEKQVENISQLKRIHKSYIINENYITKIKGNSKKASVVLWDNIQIPIRRNLYKHYKDFIKAAANHADSKD